MSSALGCQHWCDRLLHFAKLSPEVLLLACAVKSVECRTCEELTSRTGTFSVLAGPIVTARRAITERSLLSLGYEAHTRARSYLDDDRYEVSLDLWLL